ncbi:MAG: cell filamentation protein Fic [Bacteroidales bacterium]|jgi:hypothetical protein|nr:cell filamentation protein Fic [Bacteroidales bacterium]
MNTGEIIIYQNPEDNIKVDVRLEDETVWLTQEQMALLFGKARTTITEHIQNVFNEGELDEEMVCREFRHTMSCRNACRENKPRNGVAKIKR